MRKSLLWSWSDTLELGEVVVVLVVFRASEGVRRDWEPSVMEEDRLPEGW
jgi:hypothetical protein